MISLLPRDIILAGGTRYVSRQVMGSYIFLGPAPVSVLPLSEHILELGLSDIYLEVANELFANIK